MMFIDFRSWLNEVALSFQILCKSILCPLWKTLYSRILCSPVVIVLACSPVFSYQLHNSLGKWQAFIAALTLDITRRKCGVSAGVSLEQSFLFYVIYFFFRQFYRQFYGSDDPPLPVPPTCLPLFISYLTFRKLALSTITSYLSAISYVHKLRGFHDPTKSFLIHKLVTALSRRQPVDIRLPVTRPVLYELVRALNFTNSCAFQRSLFSPPFLVTFYGLLFRRGTHVIFRWGWLVPGTDSILALVWPIR